MADTPASCGLPAFREQGLGGWFLFPGPGAQLELNCLRSQLCCSHVRPPGSLPSLGGSFSMSQTRRWLGSSLGSPRACPASAFQGSVVSPLTHGSHRRNQYSELFPSCLRGTVLPKTVLGDAGGFQGCRWLSALPDAKRTDCYRKACAAGLANVTSRVVGPSFTRQTPLRHLGSSHLDWQPAQRENWGKGSPFQARHALAGEERPFPGLPLAA